MSSGEEASARSLLAQLEAEDAAFDAEQRPTLEEERAIMAATHEQAAEHGDSAKAGGEHGWVGSMMRKWERFLEKHGGEYGYDPKVGLDGGSESLELVRRFMDYCFSGLGREIYDDRHAPRERCEHHAPTHEIQEGLRLCTPTLGTLGLLGRSRCFQTPKLYGSHANRTTKPGSENNISPMMH